MNELATVCERIAATTKRLEKEKIVADYLRSLNDEDLIIASTFLSGTPFSLRDQRATNVGFAAVRDAVFELVPGAQEQFGALLLSTGDLGSAVEQLFRRRTVTPTLGLKDVLSYYDQLTTVSTNRQKRQLIGSLLSLATALEAKYVLKILLGGMRIGLQESLVESALSKAFRQPFPEIQRANMLLGDIGECALLARQGRLSEARMRLLHPLKLMLASPEENVAKILEYMQGEGLAEDKYDGIRAQIHKQDSQLKIFSRDLDDVTESFPDIVKPLSTIPGSFLLDGEILPYRDGVILSFGLLQTRLGRKIIREEILQTVPCHYFAFDILFFQDQLLLDQPLKMRREKLVQIQQLHPAIFSLATQQVIHSTEEIEAAFEASRARNNEGLVVKHPDSLYTPGKRGKSWLKLKRAMLTLDVVVTMAEYGHGKRRGLLSDYTFAVQQEGELLNIGKAYSGITDQELFQLSDLFQKTSLKDEGFAHVVSPRVVLEVTFDRIQRSNRHESGFALRFPRIKRIRWDKKPEEIDTLETVKRLHEQHFSTEGK